MFLRYERAEPGLARESMRAGSHLTRFGGVGQASGTVTPVAGSGSAILIDCATLVCTVYNSGNVHGGLTMGLPLSIRGVLSQLQHLTVLLLAIASLGASVVLSACASRNPPESQEQLSQRTATEELVEVQADYPPVHREYDGWSVDIRMATRAELPDDETKEMAAMPFIGAGSVALGLSAPPMYASGLVVGGVLLIPLGSYLYVHERKIATAMRGALEGFPITVRLGAALDRRMASRQAGEGKPRPGAAEVLIHAFGFASDATGYQPCLILVADVVTRVGQNEPVRTRIRITEKERSEEMPPPQCATLERFAEHNSMLVSETLTEYVELAAIVARDAIAKERAT